ncbi:NlpC/P60 family protein [Peribacillus asahii]|uniref:C40 family peptidase n=1 Tax=Peribacillus asahii TaxID=228899 RepID=UPI002079B281|nr:bifunctional lytic transglycosylase/C40 family peptidase [Peribacillus asahii]USK62187.1 bifunctional lytic transglycosylase/C40 family peptidase [Peribacillus asahii]
MHDTQDVGKDASKQIGKLGKAATSKGGRRALSAGAKAIAKVTRFIIQKVIGTLIKALLTYLGPVALVIITVIILVLLVIQSVAAFDIFQRGGERNATEELFDETIREVIQDRTEEIGAPVGSAISSSQQGDPYPAVDGSWIEVVESQMRPSWGMTATLYYYKMQLNESFKPWHRKYSKVKVKTKEQKKEAKEQFYKVINEAYDYYFNDPSMQPTITYSESSGEFKDVVTTVTCTSPPTEDGGEPTTSTTTTKEKVDLPPRKIIGNVEILYANLTVPYKKYETDWISKKDTSSGDCSTHIEEKYTLQVIDDSSVPSVNFNANMLLTFLLIDNPEGDLAALVKVKDLEFVMEVAKEADQNFPDLSINYEGLIECSKGSGGLEGCISANVKSSVFGNSFGNYSWFPGDFKELYEKAAEAFGVDWWIIASVHGQETTYSQNPVATSPKGNSVGARGHFQFMPRTWMGWSYRGDSQNTVTRVGNIIGPFDFTNLANIAKYGGYGLDANSNGVASPLEIEDAAFTAAKYLKASGYKKGNEKAIKKALSNYNAVPTYIEEVYNRGIMFRDGLETVPGGDGGGKSNLVEVGKRWIGNSTYKFGGGRTPSDIALGYFDCSSFVYWAYKQVGIDVGGMGNTDTLKVKGTRINISQAQPGDLVFFDTYKIDGHVGFYVGNGKFIGAQSSTGVAIADMSTGYWAGKFKGHVRRVP